MMALEGRKRFGFVTTAFPAGDKKAFLAAAISCG